MPILGVVLAFLFGLVRWIEVWFGGVELSRACVVLELLSVDGGFESLDALHVVRCRSRRPTFWCRTPDGIFQPLGYQIGVKGNKYRSKGVMKTQNTQD